MDKSATQTKQEVTRYHVENLFKSISVRERLVSGEKVPAKSL